MPLWTTDSAPGQAFGGLPVELLPGFLYGSGIFWPTRRTFTRFPLQVGHFGAYPSSFCLVSSTGRAFWGLPVELLPGFLYGSGIF